MLLRWTADACVRIGKTHAARRHYRRALEACAKYPDQCTPFDRASILLSSARLTINDGAPDDALETLQEASELLGGEQHVRERAVTLGDQHSRSVTLFNMAQIALSRQQHQRAFEALTESFRIADGLGDASGIANVGAVLGQLLLAAGDREQGLAVLGRSRDAFSLLGQADAVRQLEGLIGGA